MKKRLPSFLAGFLCAILLISLTVGVYAASEWPKTIEVGHINIMVNGKEFQPTDSKGRPVDVFVYKGTTYAPLRALAEAYGLTVGYDATKNMATVTAPGSSAQTPTTQPPVKFYSAYPDVPDFGSLSGAPISKTIPSNSGTTYYYSPKSFARESILYYDDALRTSGFSYNGQTSDSSGNVMLNYSNEKYYVSLASILVDGSEVLGVDIRPVSNTSTVKFYPAYPDIPDFGAISGASISRTLSSGDGVMYLYDVMDYDSDIITAYCDILSKNGFSYRGSFNNSDGNLVIVLSNGAHSVSIGSMWMDGVGYLSLMIGKG